MDTRQKLLDLGAAIYLADGWRRKGVNWTLVAGYFDILTPDLVRSLGAVKSAVTGEGKGTRPVMAAVLEAPDALLPSRARAELAAALRVVDYVLLLDGDTLDETLEALQPGEVIRAAADDLRRRDALIAHVQLRQKS